MTSRLVSLTFDANDPQRLAAFWATALRWQVGDGDEEEVDVLPTDGTRFRLVFVRVPEPKVGKNLIHLDLTTASDDDQRESVAQLLALGASHVDVGQTAADRHVVLADPERNELCLIEPENKFLSTCGRLGSITCDGSPTVGRFWSEAFGWPLVWDQDEETAIRHPDLTGPYITWGPPVRDHERKNRLHLDIASVEGDQHGEVERLLALGASRADIGQGTVPWVVMHDPDGNEFCVLSHRPA